MIKLLLHYNYNETKAYRVGMNIVNRREIPCTSGETKQTREQNGKPPGLSSLWNTSPGHLALWGDIGLMILLQCLYNPLMTP